MVKLDISDPLRTLVLRDALADYSSLQYRQSVALRDGRKVEGMPLAHEWDAETRERFAQGCDVRRRAAETLHREVGA